MNYYEDDGGRSIYYKGRREPDCVIRAIAIGTKTDYREVWVELCDISKSLGFLPNTKKIFETYLKNRGWHQVKLPKPYSQIQTLKIDTAIVDCRVGYGTHLTAVVDGDLYDTWDCRDRLAYSYWEKQQ